MNISAFSLGRNFNMPEEEEFYGKHGQPRKYDPTFTGPIQNRSCTDIVCCIFFILAVLGYIAVGIIAFTQGDIRKVIYPTDSQGQFCGQAGTPLENKQFLFYFNNMKCASPMVLLEFQCPTTQICVERCPDKFMKLVKAYSNQKDFDYYKSFCKEGVTSSKGVPQILCPAMLMPSKPFARRCFPSLGMKGGVITVGISSMFDDGIGNIRDAKDLVDGVKNATVVIEAHQVVMKIFEDYTQSWYWIIIGLVIAMLTSLLFIVLQRFLARFMIWVMIAMVILVFGYGSFHCYTKYTSFEEESGADETLQELDFQTDLSVDLPIRDTWLAFMIILAIVDIVIIMLLISLRKRILFTIAVIKESSKSEFPAGHEDVEKGGTGDKVG